MLDIKLIRQDPETVNRKIKTKDPEADVETVLMLDSVIREKKTRAEELKHTRNQASKEIGKLKSEGAETSEQMALVASISDEIQTLDNELRALEEQFEAALSVLPNLPADDILVSLDPKDNVFVKGYGEKPTFSFPFKNHLELNETLKLFDFERGAKISGAGWPVYRGMGARLEWALIQYMMETNIKNGFEQWIPPILVRPEVLYGSGQLPKFANQQFKINDDDFQLFLIPTAEVPLNGMHSGEILSEDELPLQYVAYTPCFRREAGAAGKKERGLIRTHQFNKIEMFAFTRPEESPAMFDKMVANAEEILQGLELHYRCMLLVTGDMSFAGARTIDVEVWLPGQDRYYEVSSITNCTDYQSRRSNIRFRAPGEKPEFVHTLNGSGLATSRLMVSILENNQQADGSVIIPKVLRKYLGGVEKITQ